jgi:hypothetical protein
MAGDSSDSGEKGRKSSSALLQALEQFVVDTARTRGAPEAKKLSGKQYVALTLFCANVIIGYLFITALLPSIEKQPVWTAIVKIVPLIVGSTFLMSWAKEFQTKILEWSSETSFLVAMVCTFVVIGALGLTQLPRYSIPVKADKDVASFCAEQVDDIDEAALASRHACAKPQSAGSLYLRSLRLGQDYMITVLYRSGSADRIDHYFVGKWAILAQTLRFRKSPLPLGSFGMLTLQQTNKDASVLHIRPVGSTGLIYIPPDHCDVDMEELRCRTSNTGDVNLALMPGDYQLQSNDCTVSPPQITLTDVHTVRGVDCR